ncbi:pyridoxamine 5'-phosphate oxidase family protein [Halobacterium wangiae]|uniref:pyridoxamine 5'-phosphate oxidase family protein n=1 Tax=Halobacterium wangiae TaxID=2902623 RepID=UPI001E52AE0B|nr:pyridoxamine 5'-phosphate oxidase family protein [Halobacterium wangiae]
MSQPVPEEVEALLTSEPLVAHLGTSHENRPHVAPLWYTYRDGSIEIVTTGRKLENIQRNPRVALSVQKDEDGRPQWGVTLQGTAEVIEDDEEGREALHRINRKYGVDEDAWSENTPVRIDVDNVKHWEY